MINNLIYLFIYRLVRFSVSSFGSLIFLASNSFCLFSQVVSVYCSFLFTSHFFLCLSWLFQTLIEQWSGKPGVESSKFSWGCRQFFFLTLLITKLISFSLLIYWSTDRWFFNQSYFHWFLQPVSCFIFSQVVSVYCSFLFPSLFVC